MAGNARSASPISPSEFEKLVDFWTLNETGDIKATQDATDSSSTNPLMSEVNHNVAKESTNPFLNQNEEPLQDQGKNLKQQRFHSTQYVQFTRQNDNLNRDAASIRSPQDGEQLQSRRQLNPDFNFDRYSQQNQNYHSTLPYRQSFAEHRHRRTDVFRWKIAFIGDKSGLSLNDFLSQAEELSKGLPLRGNTLKFGITSR
jgi:hypothetical protein